VAVIKINYHGLSLNIICSMVLDKKLNALRGNNSSTTTTTADYETAVCTLQYEMQHSYYL